MSKPESKIRNRATQSASRRAVDELTDKTRGPRLQKVLAGAGVASRRACETFILKGRIKVNGYHVTELPVFVNPLEDRIELDGNPLSIIKPKRRGSHSARTRTNTASSGRHTHVILHKPKRVITTTHDPHGRRHVLDLLPPELLATSRLFPVGRLDADSTGLILLTDDGELANRLTHPRYEVAKQYHITVHGRLNEKDLELLKKGVILAHQRVRRHHPSMRRAAMAQVKLIGFSRDKTRGDRTRLSVQLLEGQNREIRRILARMGHKVRRLERVAIGPIKLKGLAVGEWRILKGAEAKRLYNTVGI